jgi:hypothetical protein
MTFYLFATTTTMTATTATSSSPPSSPAGGDDTDNQRSRRRVEHDHYHDCDSDAAVQQLGRRRGHSLKDDLAPSPFGTTSTMTTTQTSSMTMSTSTRRRGCRHRGTSRLGRARMNGFAVASRASNDVFSLSLLLPLLLILLLPPSPPFVMAEARLLQSSLAAASPTPSHAPFGVADAEVDHDKTSTEENAPIAMTISMMSPSSSSSSSTMLPTVIVRQSAQSSYAPTRRPSASLMPTADLSFSFNFSTVSPTSASPTSAMPTSDSPTSDNPTTDSPTTSEPTT